MATSMCTVMNCFSRLKLLNSFHSHNCLKLLTASYAKKVGGSGATSKAGGKSASAAPPRLRLVPESDPVKLTTFLCGGNISREGGADPELKPESEYPEWLWTLRTDKGSPSLDELDPNTWDYWRKLRTMNTKRRMSILKDKFKYRRF